MIWISSNCVEVLRNMGTLCLNNLCLACHELMTFYLIFFCLLYSLYMIVGVFPLTVLMFGCIFVYLGLCNIIFYFDYLIFSFFGMHFKGILKFISYNWNKISQFHIFVFCSILLDYCVKKSLCQKNIFNNI